MSLTSSNNLLVESYRAHTGHLVGFTSVKAGNLAFHVTEAPDTADQVRASRTALEQNLGIDPGSTQYLHQIHSADVVVAGGRGWATQVEPVTADASVSPDGTQALAIMVADCLPVVFVAGSGATAVAHAGRVGLVNGVLENTIHRLRAVSAAHGDDNMTAEIEAWIGPAICGKCYEVPEQMRAELTSRHPNLHSETSWGTPALDLPGTAEHLMTELGVTVRRSQICTLEDDRVFSHRRGTPTGRCAGLVFKTRHETPQIFPEFGRS